MEFRSFSKNGGFTGVRCAYIVIPKTLKGYSADGSEQAIHPLWSRRHSTKFNGASYPVQTGAAAVFSEEGKKQVAALIEGDMGNAKLLREACTAAGLPDRICAPARICARRAHGGARAGVCARRAPAACG